MGLSESVIDFVSRSGPCLVWPSGSVLLEEDQHFQSLYAKRGGISLEGAIAARPLSCVAVPRGGSPGVSSERWQRSRRRDGVTQHLGLEQIIPFSSAFTHSNPL